MSNPITRFILILPIVFTVLIRTLAAQVPTQEQLQSADAQLNKVYQQLKGSLNPEQKQQLKGAQRDWINQRDALVTANPQNPRGALYQSTVERIAVLQKVFQQVKGEYVVTNSNDKGRGSLPGNYSPPVEYNKVEPIYQEVSWDSSDVVAEALGTRFRAVSLVGSNKIYVFDVKTRLLFGVIENSAGLMSESDPARLICFSGNQRYIYSQKTSDKGECFQFNEVPSLLTALAGTVYRQQIEGPFTDESQNLGVCIHRLEQPSEYNFTSSIKLDPNRYSSSPDSSAGAQINAQFLRYYPDLALRLGVFEENVVDPFIKPNAVSGVLVQTKNLVLNREGECKADQNKADTNVFIQAQKENTLAIGITNNTIFLHNELYGEKFTIAIDIDNLSSIKEKWNGPTIIKNSLLKGDLIGYVHDEKASSISSEENGIKYTIQNEGGYFKLQINNPSEKPISIYPEKGNQNHSLQAYCYTGPLPVTVGYWVFPEKYAATYQIGIYNNKLGKWIAVQSNDRLNRSVSEIPSHFWDSEKAQIWLSSSNSISQIDLSSGSLIQSYDVGKKFEAFALSEKRIFGMSRMDEKRGEIWNRDPLKKVCDILWSDDGNIMIYNNNGYYASKAKSFKSIAAKSGDGVYPFEQFDLKLNRPDIIFDELGFSKDQVDLLKVAESKRLKRMGVTEEMLKPDFHLPQLQIVGDVPATTAKDQIDLQINATDDKYPLERLRVYVNNVPVNGRDGELLRDQKTQNLEKTIPIKLASGRNKIQVSVLNSAGAESLYANAEVTCKAERPKPKLYAVALGVSKYERPEWCLKYAAKDATDLIEKLKVKAGSDYSEVKPLLLTDKDVTKESVARIKEFLSGATIDDTVLIFMAGHGILDDKYDYYFGTTDIDPAKPSERGMPYEAIDNILAEVPSLQKALLMDTCHAGELDDDEKKELAAQDGGASSSSSPDNATNSSSLAGKVAMRSIGTRGMTVKAIQGAKGKSDWYDKLQDMFVDLRRGSGATVISSSQGAEYAYESSEQSNGLFTYALMEALDGKAAANKDGQITITTVGDYVKKRVQDLTKGKQNPNLRGVNLEEDFTLSAAK